MNYTECRLLLIDKRINMKRIIAFIILLFTTYGIILAQGETVAQQARLAYDSAQYHKTIEILEKEREAQIANNLESADLYYNLGNAYYRVDNLAKARLNYERAALLNPGDSDIKGNIEFIKTKIEDKIPVADSFFLGVWFRAVQNWFSSNGWAKIAVISFLLFIACLSVFFFSRKEISKKISFYCGIIFITFIIFANIFSYNQKKRIEIRDTAIIMTGAASVLSAPDSNSKELFILHAGTKVTITKEDRYWFEIEIDNGSVGWIQRDKLEII